jgi:DMSO/TMAO reductase YedYZ molybdopterin-dependent catalytic subunit
MPRTVAVREFLLLLSLPFACIAQDEVPPGQTEVSGGNFPVFSFRGDRHMSTSGWTLELFGLVENDTTLTWDDFTALPMETRAEDFHCVTGWSRLNDEWTGVSSRTVADIAVPDSSVVAVMIHSADGYTTNLLLEDFLKEGVMLVTHMNGESITPAHGYPVRLIVPHLYAYKAAKWVTGIEFLSEEEEGYWELRGYHVRGDPWQQERYSH